MNAFNEERVKQIAAHLKNGLAYSEIAALLRISRGAVAGIVHRHLKSEAAEQPANQRARRRREQEAVRRNQAARLSDVPVEAQGEFVPLGINVMDIRGDQCRFIDGNPKGEWSFCGHKVASGSYCAYHTRVVYTEKR